MRKKIISALILGPAVDQTLTGLREFADNHPVSMEALKDTMAGRLPPVGDNPEYVRELPVGFKVVLSVEYQPIGPCYHVSVSVARPNKLPSQVAVDEILKRLIGRTRAEAYEVWTDPNSAPPSVNLLFRNPTN